jgi:hypothetical protein
MKVEEGRHLSAVLALRPRFGGTHLHVLEQRLVHEYKSATMATTRDGTDLQFFALFQRAVRVMARACVLQQLHVGGIQPFPLGAFVFLRVFLLATGVKRVK